MVRNSRFYGQNGDLQRQGAFLFGNSTVIPLSDGSAILAKTEVKDYVMRTLFLVVSLCGR